MTQLFREIRVGKIGRAGLLFSVFILLAAAVLLRFWRLNSIPVAYYHDELDYVITGQSIRQWGTDLTGDWRPTLLIPVKTQNIASEITPVVHALVQTVFPRPVNFGRLPGALFGAATVLLTGLLFWRLLHQWQPAVLAMVWVAANPWHIYISRLGYEAVISLFFQLLMVSSVVLFMQSRTKWTASIWLVLSFLAQWMAFYTYHSAKFLIPVITVAVLAWSWLSRRSWKLTAITGVVLLGSALSLLGHSLAVQRSGGFGARQSEMIFSQEYLQETVNLSRHQAMQVPGMRWWYNKPVVAMSEFVKHYASVFDIYRIFITGYEGGFQFSLAVHGFFTISSVPLIILGMVWLWRQNRTAAFLIVSLLVVAPIPSAIMRSYQSIFRSALVYLLLAMLAGLGVWSLWQWLSKQRWGILIWPMVTIFFQLSLQFFKCLLECPFTNRTYLVSHKREAARWLVDVGDAKGLNF